MYSSFATSMRNGSSNVQKTKLLHQPAYLDDFMCYAESGESSSAEMLAKGYCGVNVRAGVAALRWRISGWTLKSPKDRGRNERGTSEVE